MRDFSQFLDFCYDNRNNYSYLAYQGGFDRVVNYQENNHNGHFIQLFYAIYDFFTSNPRLIFRIGVPPFDISDDPVLFNAWFNFIHDDTNDANGFNTESLRRNLSPVCGGNRDGGGGWSPTAKIMFPTVAIYMNP